MLNHHLSQKLKLIGRGKFNHLINTLTFVMKCNMIVFMELLKKKKGPNSLEEFLEKWGVPKRACNSY
jgi:hypothetical protein